MFGGQALEAFEEDILRAANHVTRCLKPLVFWTLSVADVVIFCFSVIEKCFWIYKEYRNDHNSALLIAVRAEAEMKMNVQLSRY